MIYRKAEAVQHVSIGGLSPHVPRGRLHGAECGIGGEHVLRASDGAALLPAAGGRRRQTPVLQGSPVPVPLEPCLSFISYSFENHPDREYQLGITIS